MADSSTTPPPPPPPSSNKPDDGKTEEDQDGSAAPSSGTEKNGKASAVVTDAENVVPVGVSHDGKEGKTSEAEQANSSSDAPGKANAPPVAPDATTPATGGGVELTSRDVILGKGSVGIVMNELLNDMIRLECILWKLGRRPVPTSITQPVRDVSRKIMAVIQKGKPLELAGLKDVPRPFLKSQGRFLTRTDEGVFQVIPDDRVVDVLGGLLLTEFKKTANFEFSWSSPYKEFKKMIDIAGTDSSGPGSNPKNVTVVMVPDPKDAILLRRGASNADKLYENHVGNKVIFTLISYLVTTHTTTTDARIQAALHLIHGLQDAVKPTNMPSDESLQPDDDSPDAASTIENNNAARKGRFLLRNIREDESVFWSVLNPVDAALFALCFVFEVFLEKEIHLQLPQQPSFELKDAEPPLMDHSKTVPIENPLEYDVLFGRGGMTNAHPGNKRFRDLIALHRPDYVRALKMDKPAVARKIVKAIRRTGRFLKKEDDGLWYDVGNRTAAEKTSQGLRERSNAEKRQRSALREALRIRRQDDDDETEGDKNEETSRSAVSEEESANKKQKTDHKSPNVAMLNYEGTNLAVPLSLGMKDGPNSTPRRKTTTPVKGRSCNGAELFTEGLPPNAVDENGNILVTDFDILCGRGGLTNHHKGNKRFRDIVALHRADYVRAPKIQKPSVARVIVRAIRNGDPPGRFLRKDEKRGIWIDIGDKKAAEKTSQALREKTNEERDKLKTEYASLGSPPNVILPNSISHININTDSSAIAAIVQASELPKKSAKASSAGNKRETRTKNDSMSEARKDQNVVKAAPLGVSQVDLPAPETSAEKNTSEANEGEDKSEAEAEQARKTIEEVVDMVTGSGIHSIPSVVGKTENKKEAKATTTETVKPSSDNPETVPAKSTNV